MCVCVCVVVFIVFFFLRGGAGPGPILKREKAHFRTKNKCRFNVRDCKMWGCIAGGSRGAGIRGFREQVILFQCHGKKQISPFSKMSSSCLPLIEC